MLNYFYIYSNIALTYISDMLQMFENDFVNLMWDLTVSVPDHCLSFYFDPIFKVLYVTYIVKIGNISM